LHHVHQLPTELKDSFLAPLLGTLSNLANTVGKQFAQPIRPRESNGNIKPYLGQRVNKDRTINVFKEYDSWVQRYLSIVPNQFDHRSFRMDYTEALDNISEDTTIVYADPPYTRDHYSRYYHTLETICLRDMPEISTMVSKGKTQISRGVYRKERHQSPFCIKSQAGEAFKKLVSKCHGKKLDLIISYSPYDEAKKSHPRLLKMDQLTQTAKTFYKNVSVISPGVFSHSKLTSSDKHLEASEQAEVLVICKA
jgi:adenine-specific DNA methylase